MTTFTRTKTVTATVAAFALGLTLSACASGEGSQADAGPRLSIDYAYYNPLSLVVRDQKCLENALSSKGVAVEWVLSAGSNKANENLNADVIDIGSTAGAAAFTARANGAAIKTIAVFSQPEWTAIVVGKDSPITDVTQLKGTKIAATKGTDPYFFLLRALNEAGLSQADVEIVNLQHADGQAALLRGDVDAWAGLDPIMATTELKDGSRLLYRNAEFPSYGVLNARENFLKESPELVDQVLTCYQSARAWTKANPADAAALLAKEASLETVIAEKVLTERTNVDISIVPGPAQQAVLEAVLPVFVAEGLVRSEQEARTALDTLYDTTFAERAPK